MGCGGGDLEVVSRGGREFLISRLESRELELLHSSECANPSTAFPSSDITS